MKRYVALGAALAALGAGGTALVQGAAAGGSAAQAGNGGLSVFPALIEHNAQPGTLTEITVANRSKDPLEVTVTPRPWVQSAGGKVSPNRRSTLRGVEVSESEFTLAAGAEKKVTATLTGASAGYLYGAVEVIGVPEDADSRKGVVLGYRLVSALRVVPAAPKYGLKASKAKVSRRTAVIPVKNTGNTVDQVTGSVRLKSARGTKHLTVAAFRVLPGKRVNLPAGSRLAKGAYSAKVSLTQHGKRVLSTTKKFKVK
jgi:hypothetical protein